MDKLKQLYIILIIISVFIVGCSNSNIKNKNQLTNPIEKELNKVQDGKETNKIKDKIDNMTLDEKIGQLLIVGFEGTTIDNNTRYLIENLKVGGVILFQRNIKNIDQVVDLTNGLKDINKNNKAPLFISTDEEGGNISRLPEGYKKLPNAKQIGDLDDLDFSFKFGELLGIRLKSLGINLNYGPVMDINSNPSNPVIGNRAFGNKSKIVTRNGIGVLKGIKSVNVIPSIKHFPGHGDTDMDSHVNLPIINKSLEDIKKLELIPFQRSIEEGIDMVMVAHILFPEIDKNYPSTMSENIINKLLREELGYDGVVISDDLTMGAITKNYSLEDASLKFLEAGGDIILICHGIDNPSKIVEYIKEAVEKNILTIEDIDKKLYRILSLKDKYHLEDNSIEIPNMEEINKKTEKLLNKIK